MSLSRSSLTNRIILLYYKHLLLIALLTVALTWLFTSAWFIAPRYKSQAIVYPINITPFSAETPSEQVQQVLLSDEIAQNIIRQFNLASHYQIDTTKIHYKTRLNRLYHQNVSIRKTRFESIVIEAMDKDPVVACEMVEGIIENLNKKMQQMQASKSLEWAQFHQSRLSEKKRQIDSLEARLDSLRKHYGILDYSIQTREFTRQWVKQPLSQGRNDKVNEFLVGLGEKGGEFQLLGGFLSSVAGTYNQIKAEYDQAISESNRKLSYVTVVSKPLPAEKPSYPPRVLITILSVISVIILSILFISILEITKSERKTDASH